MPKSKKVYSISISPAVDQMLEEMAVKEGRTVSNLLQRLILKDLKNNCPQPKNYADY